jgi:regulator of nonsense transcripts 1
MMDRKYCSGSPVSLIADDESATTPMARRSGTPSRFDASFYRTHDALGYIPSDVQSLRSQATYSSGLPVFGAPGPFGPGMPRVPGVGKRSTYSYASSIVSQDAGPSVTDNGSVAGGDGDGGSNVNIAYSQSDRLRRRSSFGSASVTGQSDLGSLSQFDYKSQDDGNDMDDMKSQYAGTQSGVTVF